jgi:hypothetical protein
MAKFTPGRESLHSPTPIGPGAPEEGCSYRRVLCARAAAKPRVCVGVWGGAKRRTGAPYSWSDGSSDPMREAGAPSTGGWVVPAPPGIVMVSPPEVPRNAERAQSTGRAGEDRQVRDQRGQGHCKGRNPAEPRPCLLIIPSRRHQPAFQAFPRFPRIQTALAQ